MELLKVAADHAGDLCQLATCAALLIRPVREWMFGTTLIKEGLRCLLRSEIVSIYYRHRDDKTLKEYEYKNLEFCHKAYKALKGNSFIDHIHAEMQEWEII